MAKTKKRDGGAARIDLLRPVQILQEEITEPLCEEVFREQRSKERPERLRSWTLHLLVEFWTAIILRAPKALRHALEEAREPGAPNGWPAVPTTPEAFFQISQNWSWRFFARLFERFVERVLPKALPVFCRDFAAVRERFSEVLAVDGSRLDAVAHRLEILREVTRRVLPGCILAVYDLFRGIPRLLKFDADAAKSEFKRFVEIVALLPEGALLLGDRLFCSLQIFAALAGCKAFGLFRRNQRISIRKKKRLSRQRLAEGLLEDWLVEAGSGQRVPKQDLRWIRFKKGRSVYEVLTNVMDPARLPPLEAVALYFQRWSIERMFYDLKEVLNLHHFYAANPNAIGMQLYAAALVYTALRIAQGMAAKEVSVAPEEISTEKLFPKVASAAYHWSVISMTLHEVHIENPNVKIRDPDWSRKRFASTTLDKVRVEKRSGVRKKRRFCEGRKRWTSFAKIPGGKKLIRASLN